MRNSFAGRGGAYGFKERIRVGAEFTALSRRARLEMGVPRDFFRELVSGGPGRLGIKTF
jgi:hypothetical protein